MPMVAYTPQKLMQYQASAMLRALAEPEDRGFAHWKMTPPAPAGQTDIQYLDGVRDAIASSPPRWKVTALDVVFPATNWNGFGMTYTDENGVSKTFDIRTS